MEKIEMVYEFMTKTKFEYVISNAIRDINIIDFAILSYNDEYKEKIYNTMREKYSFDLDKMGYSKALNAFIEKNMKSSLSKESIIRNNLSILRKWIIRCSGYMCVRKVAEANVEEGIDSYMKKYTIVEDVCDTATLRKKTDELDEDILSCLESSI